MSLEANKAIARRHFEDVWNRGDMEAADAIYAPNYEHHAHGLTDLAVHGREELKRIVTETRRNFGDVHFTIQEMVAEGDKVVTRWIHTFTHSNEMVGIAPTGKVLTHNGIDIARIVDGKIVENWNSTDELGIYLQLGAMLQVP